MADLSRKSKRRARGGDETYGVVPQRCGTLRCGTLRFYLELGRADAPVTAGGSQYL